MLAGLEALRAQAQLVWLSHVVLYMSKESIKCATHSLVGMLLAKQERH